MVPMFALIHCSMDNHFFEIEFEIFDYTLDSLVASL